MRWFFVMLGLAAPVWAEPLPDLFDVLAEIDGREVQVEGNLISVGAGDASLQTGQGTFTLEYALPRDQIKRATECTEGGNLFSRPKCPVRISAELVKDGSFTKLFVFDIEFLE